MIRAASDYGQAGPLGLLVIVLLGLACYLLFKSMSRHLRKVRDEWPDRPQKPDDDTTPGPGPEPPAS